MIIEKCGNHQSAQICSIPKQKQTNIHNVIPKQQLKKKYPTTQNQNNINLGAPPTKRNTVSSLHVQ